MSKQYALNSFLKLETNLIFLKDKGKLFQNCATLGKKENLNIFVLA